MGFAGRSVLISGLAAVLFTAPFHSAMAVVVRYEFSLNGSSFGTVDVRLFQTAMPRTVANFLHYVDDDDWDGSFIHRRAALSDSGVAVIQGGGYKLPPTGLLTNIDGQLFYNYDDVPADAAIADEPGNGVAGPSNVRGTIAMAKSGPNTVTSEWFFNTIANTVLDDPTDPDTGGFSAFGRVLGSGMNVVDNIWNLPRVQIGTSGPFTTLPVYDVPRVQSQQNVFNADVVLVTDIHRLDLLAGDYNFDGVVNNADYSIWKGDFGSTTKAEADGNGDGVVNAADYVIWRNSLSFTLAGDYDLNSVVNTADYSVWKANFGSATNSAVDGNGDGIVNAADYTIWRNFLGFAAPPGSGSGGVVAGEVPEPTSMLLIAIPSAVLAQLVRRRNRAGR
jgi:cyclophilin family peptidyl-prolyl cis-trans isomerase